MMRRFLVPIVLLVLAACARAPDLGVPLTPTTHSPTHRTYRESTANIANPERGFYHAKDGDCDKDLFDVATLKGYREKENITLVRCVFYLREFREKPLDATTLGKDPRNTFDEQAARVRQAGLKMIVRFAYHDPNRCDNALFNNCAQTVDCKEAVPINCEPLGSDASFTWVKHHLVQLTPVLQRNSDVIAVVESGFVGAWGEGFHTKNFGDGGVVSSTDWEHRKYIVDELMKILPSRMILVRTIKMKRKMYFPDAPGAEATPVSSTDYGTKPAARVGYYNDCFLRNNTDFDTYRNPLNPSLNNDWWVPKEDYPDRLKNYLLADKAYLEKDSTYVAMGGETCGVPTPEEMAKGTLNRTDCDLAEPEMKRFHYTYLNQDYHQDIIKKWIIQGCKTGSTSILFGQQNRLAINHKLGYRFSMTSSDHSVVGRRGTLFTAKITIRNAGWAASINRRSAYMMVRNVTTRVVDNKKMVAFDVRKWLPGTNSSITYEWNIPLNQPIGTYEILLHLPDPASSVSRNPAYAIKLAKYSCVETGCATTFPIPTPSPWDGYNSLTPLFTVK